MAAAPDTDYVVVLGATSDARFEEGEGLLIANYPTPVGPADFRFLTRYEDRGFEANVPLDMWVEVRGTASATIKEVIEAYANTALGFLPLIAIAANAWIDDLEIKLAYDNTPGRHEREFFQSFTSPLEPDAIRLPKQIDRDATYALIVAIANHEEAVRLRRAAEQYRLALSNWLNGHEALAIAHLWMAVEALTKVALRRECREAGNLEPAELAVAWGVKLTELDGEVRRRAIFRGDDAAGRKAREASDGLEHAYLDFGAIRELARETRDTTASYLRAAIIEFADLDEPWLSRLLDDRYAQPLKSWIVRYLEGNLIGATVDLAAPDQAYPQFTRTQKLKTLRVRPNGSYEFQMEENYQGSFNKPFVQFEPASVETWGAREDAEGSVEATEVIEQDTTTEEQG